MLLNIRTRRRIRRIILRPRRSLRPNHLRDDLVRHDEVNSFRSRADRHRKICNAGVIHPTRDNGRELNFFTHLKVRKSFNRVKNDFIRGTLNKNFCRINLETDNFRMINRINFRIIKSKTGSNLNIITRLRRTEDTRHLRPKRISLNFVLRLGPRTNSTNVRVLSITTSTGN